jgi:ABC-type antimicrobial peptide transport system permease subunit
LLIADPGFKSEGVLTFQLAVGSVSLFPKPQDSYAYQDRVDAALRGLPGVISAGATTKLPLSGGGNVPSVEFPGAPGNTGDPKRDNPAVTRLPIRPGYIGAIGMRLVEGRDFEVARREGVEDAIIDVHLARQFFPNSSPLGTTVLRNGHPMTVVGVVEQARLDNLHSDDKLRHFYVRAEDSSARPSYYAVRTAGDPRALITEIRTVLRQIDRRVPIWDIRTMEEIVADARSRERISAALIAGVALGTLLLVSMGLFGMISGSVVRRRGELAVRMALGATYWNVIGLVVSEGARLITLGLLIGIPGIYIAGQTLRGFLVGVSPFDLATIASVAAGLVIVALLACYLAARRVTRIAPERLLREGG